MACVVAPLPQEGRRVLADFVTMDADRDNLASTGEFGVPMLDRLRPAAQGAADQVGGLLKGGFPAYVDDQRMVGGAEGSRQRGGGDA